MPADKWEWQRLFSNSDLTPTQRLVLHVLAMRMDPDGSRCYPPLEDSYDDETGQTKPGLIRLTGLSRSGLLKALKELKAAGWLRVESGRRGRASHYLMAVPEDVGVHEVDHKVHAVDHNSPPDGPHQTTHQTNDQTTLPAGEVVALVDRHWSAVSTAKERVKVSAEVEKVCVGWSTATTEAVVAWVASEARGISLLRWALEQVEGKTEDEALARVRVRRGGGGRTSSRAGTADEFPPTGKLENW